MANLKTPGDVSKSWVNAQKLLGEDKIPVPKGPDDPNLEVILGKLGRPEKADGYQLPTIENLPAGFTIEAENVKGYTELAHKVGLTNTQASELFKYYIERNAGLHQQAVTGAEETRAATEKQLRLEWGIGYDAQIALAKKTLSYAAGDSTEALAEKYGNDPVFLKALAKLGNDLGEDILGKGGPMPGELTRESAQKELDEIQGNPEHPYHVKEKAGHEAAVARVHQLYQILYPGETPQ